jgi:hypothetical protein
MIMCEIELPPGKYASAPYHLHPARGTGYDYALLEGLRLICSHISTSISSIYSEIRYVLPHTVQHNSIDFQPIINLINPLHSLHFIRIFLAVIGKTDTF